MVYVKLQSDWTDGNGVSHPAGDSVDVDAATLATLQAEGIVSEQSHGPVATARPGQVGRAGQLRGVTHAGDAERPGPHG